MLDMDVDATTSTCSNETGSSELTAENLEETIRKLALSVFKWPDLPKHKPSLLERVMRKFGWYRQTTVYVIDRNRFNDTWLTKKICV